MNWYDRLKAKIGTKYAAEVSAVLSAAVLFAGWKSGGLTAWAAIYYFLISVAVGGIGNLVRMLFQAKVAQLANADQPVQSVPGLPQGMVAAAVVQEKATAAAARQTGEIPMVHR